MRNQPPHEGIRILHYSKKTSFPEPLLFGLAYVSAFKSSHACTWSSWGIQCDDTLLRPPQICPTHNIPGIHGIPSMPTLWWIFGLGSEPKDIWSESSCPTEETKMMTPHRVILHTSDSMTLKSVCMVE